MALKDLVADRSKLTEAAIEEVVRDYVRYDPGSYDLVLTPAGLALSSDAKILVLLVAIAGWQYVVDNVQPVDTRPASLEKMTGIPGGTLRPVLKKLKDAHLIASTGDGYVVRIGNLEAIKDAIARARSHERPAAKTRRRNSTSVNDSTSDNSGILERKSAAKTRRKLGAPIQESLARLIELGFFAENRTLSQVVTRLHEMAIIVKTTSISGPIAGLVRDGRLVRKKIAPNGKLIWSYKDV